MSKKKKNYIKLIYSPCPKCKKVIERIGVFQKNVLIGFIGTNCRNCGTFEKADPAKIELLNESIKWK